MIIVNTSTHKDYITVIKWAIGKGMRWASGSKSIHKDYWDVFEHATCVIVKNEKLTYGDVTFSVENYDTDILSMKQFNKISGRYKFNEFIKKFDLR